MATETSLVVSVRMKESDLRKLQLIAQIYQGSVGELIRAAVDQYIKTITRTKDFKTKAPKILKRNEEMLNELLDVSGVKTK